MKKINLILGRVILISWLTLMSSSAFAAWGDDRDNVIDRIISLQNALQNIVSQMENGRGAVSAGNLQDSINDVTGLLGDTLPSQAEVQAFVNQGCEAFRNDLTMLSNGLFGLGNSLANFHGLPVGFQIQDLNNFILCLLSSLVRTCI